MAILWNHIFCTFCIIILIPRNLYLAVSLVASIDTIEMALIYRHRKDISRIRLYPLRKTFIYWWTFSLFPKEAGNMRLALRKSRSDKLKITFLDVALLDKYSCQHSTTNLYFTTYFYLLVHWMPDVLENYKCTCSAINYD